MVVDLDGCLQLGEVIYFLAQDLFSYAFVIGLVGVSVEVEEGHWQEEGNTGRSMDPAIFSPRSSTFSY